ncbi:M28 family peptidase [Fulvivirga sp. M361]|uniref:M28 family peptidase n=1 Tax=Fulvivirga sp. M361 TaxID=2594266 RepID=UPI00117A0D42|nr:M28 family peptidase [Fulvivirga sp. M361]TRX50201.1 M28 family peptidase [Fulvivirga sp. M361]
MNKYILLLSIVTCFSAYAQSDEEFAKSTNNKATIEGHIYFLASDELRGRDMGTPEIDIAAKYLATTFRRYGVKPVSGADNGYFQPVIVENVKPAQEISFLLAGIKYDDLVILEGTNAELDANVVFAGYGLEDDYAKKEVEGKLVVVWSGSEGHKDPNSAFSMVRKKREVAKAKGAVGLIEVNAAGSDLWKRIKSYLNREQLSTGSDEEDNFIHAWLEDTENKLSSAIKKNTKASFRISGMEKTRIPAQNVVGMVEGTDPELRDEFVIYSAHYDHIGVGTPNAEGDSIYNGARDNAVGVVTVLSAAENIAKHPTKRSALFILFTGEEKGLLGSKWYTEHPLIPLNQMVYCFNSDNGGYNDTSVATIIGLERTTATDHIKSACTAFGLTAIDDPAPEQGLFDRSDNVNFASKGIPAPTFSLGFRAFDAEIGKYYHQVEDNPDNIDYDYLTSFFGAYVLACRLIANDPVKPFWVEGDKYHSAGVDLYKDK